MRHNTSKVNGTQGEDYRVPCAGCNNPTRHTVVASYDLMREFDGGDITEWDSYQIVQCLGCEAVSFRLSRKSTEDFDITDGNEWTLCERYEVYPPRAAGRAKLRDTRLLPYPVADIYEETHKALCSELPILAAIGIRALVEAVCAEQEAEGDNLRQKIDGLVEQGVLTKAGADILHQVRFLGNEAAHEVRRHNLETLSTAFDVAENLLQSVYILPEKAARLAKGSKDKRYE
jgi:hypothetical protein